jgi:Family of unknown function (DUF6441)
MALKFKVKVEQSKWIKMIRDKQRPVATAAVAALRETAANAVQEGRSDIASAGRFRGGWQTGLQYRTVGAVDAGEPSLQAKAIIFHKIGLAGAFEFGMTIQGRPLLWIPTTPGAPPAGKFRRKLVSVNVAGKPPMLFDAFDRNRGGERRPLYIGVPQARIPKKFHIIEIVKNNAARIAELFIKHFKGQ